MEYRYPASPRFQLSRNLPTANQFKFKSTTNLLALSRKSPPLRRKSPGIDDADVDEGIKLAGTQSLRSITPLLLFASAGKDSKH